MHIGGIVIAGGKSRRMEYYDKSLKEINKKTLIGIVYGKARKQVDLVGINSNTINKIQYFKNVEFLKDSMPGHLGPLLGILTGIEWLIKKDLNLTQQKIL